MSGCFDENVLDIPRNEEVGYKLGMACSHFSNRLGKASVGKNDFFTFIRDIAEAI
jgi:hypothetical protein